MPIVAGDIDFHLSGGVGNTDPNLALGGVRSTTQVVDNVDNNIFDDVTGTEAGSGDTEYRGLYFRNAHATITLLNTRIWIESNTTSTDDTADIALAGEGLNATMETVANENTAPVGEVFSAPANYAAGLVMGSVPATQHYGFWIRRTVNASAAAFNANSFQLKLQGETSA